MGNCHSSSKDEYLCNICKNNLNEKYIVCNYCDKRFHYRCLLNYSPSLSTCILCGSTKIKCINITRNSFDRI